MKNMKITADLMLVSGSAFANSCDWRTIFNPRPLEVVQRTAEEASVNCIDGQVGARYECRDGWFRIAGYVCLPYNTNSNGGE